jgi:hypothetical protein
LDFCRCNIHVFRAVHGFWHKKENDIKRVTQTFVCNL